MLAKYNILLAIFTCCIISYLNGFFAVNLINPLKIYPTLPDIGFYFLPIVSPIYAHVLLLCYGIYFAFRFISLKNLFILTKIVWTITILFFLRLLTFTSTILPPTNISCYYRQNTSPIHWFVIDKLLLYDHNTCIDYMFSGHTVYFCVIYLGLIFMSRSRIEKIIFFVYTFICLIIIIASRIHYTVDVIVAISLSITIFNIIVKR